MGERGRFLAGGVWSRPGTSAEKASERDKKRDKGTLLVNVNGVEVIALDANFHPKFEAGPTRASRITTALPKNTRFIRFR